MPEHGGIFNWLLEGWLAYRAEGMKLQPSKVSARQHNVTKRRWTWLGRGLRSPVNAPGGPKIPLKDIYAAFTDRFNNTQAGGNLPPKRKLSRALECSRARSSKCLQLIVV